MDRTRPFAETVTRRLRDDPAFAPALLTEAIQALLDGEVDLGVLLLRQTVEGTIGFDRFSALAGIPRTEADAMLQTGTRVEARTLLPALARLREELGPVETA